MKSLFVALTILAASMALADNRQCLERASNFELLKEVELRMGGSNGGDSSSAFSASFSCGGNAEVIINSVNLSTGANSSYKISTGDWTQCRSLSSLLTSKIGSVTLHTGKIIAVCGGNAEVSRVLVNASGIKLVSKVSTGDWNVCRQEAEQNNANLSK